MQRDLRPRLTMKAYIDGIGLLAPGLASWRTARPVLAGEARYAPGEMPRPTAEIRRRPSGRRCGDLVKLRCTSAPRRRTERRARRRSGDGVHLRHR
jgi:hypothetical protein